MKDSHHDHQALPREGWFAAHYLAVDTRWLGIFRIGFGLLLSVELVRRWNVARDFYSNEGVLTNHFSLFLPIGEKSFSIYHAFSDLPQVHVAFALTLVVFLMLTVGYQTKIFQILSFLCITSLNARNLLVENGGTIAVNHLAMWSMFLPLGRTWSIDALRQSMAAHVERSEDDLNAVPPSRVEEHRIHRLAFFALLLQWSVAYFFTCVHKSGRGWLDGSAIHWFLHQDRIVTAVGVWAREHLPFGVTRALTYATLVVEGVLGGLLLIPWAQRQCRLVAFALAALLHGGIALLARLGPFSYVMTLFFLIPLSPRDYDIFVGRGRGRAVRVIYDGECGLCFWLCRVLRRLDAGGRLTFQSSSRALGENDAARGSSVLVIDTAGERYEGLRALSRIADALPLASLGLGFLLRLPGLSHLGGALYRRVTQKRGQVAALLGAEKCEPPSAPRLAATAPSAWRKDRPVLGTLTELAVVVALAMFAIEVLRDNPWFRTWLPGRPRQPPVLERVVQTFRLFQGWTMFAPEPPYEDGRLVVDARTVDGRRVDPLTGLEPDFAVSAPHGWGHDQFWCDFSLKMSFPGFAPYRAQFLEYLQRWHERTGKPEDRLVAFDLWWVGDRSPPPGQLQPVATKPVKLDSFGRVPDSRVPSEFAVVP